MSLSTVLPAGAKVEREVINAEISRYGKSQSIGRQKRIAVLVPCYNEELTVAEVVNSF